MKVRAARMLPFWRYLHGKLRIAVQIKNQMTYGIVPRRANAPGEPPADNHWTNISANKRALSRLPEARKCGSAS